MNEESAYWLYCILVREETLIHPTNQPTKKGGGDSSSKADEVKKKAAS